LRSLNTFPGRSAARRAAACRAADLGSFHIPSFEQSRISSAPLRAALRPGSVLLCVAVLLCLFASLAFAFDFPELTGRVVDQAGIVSPAIKSDVEAKSKALEEKSGIQLVVATVKTLEGNDVETYANELFRFWKLGEAQKNNGVLLLVAPYERKVRIEVGYGLEGTLTDALASVIISSVIVPRFKSNDFSGGIERGVDGIIGVLGTDSAAWQAKALALRSNGNPLLDNIVIEVAIAWCIFVFVAIFVLGYRSRYPKHYVKRHGRRVVVTADTGSRSSGWSSDSWSGSSSSGGSSSDSGFSGGGGSSGGGGASGSW
jgi:uncharacterized protein